MDEAAFLLNELVQDAVIRNLEILGEASNNIQKHYPDFTVKHPELPLAFASYHRDLRMVLEMVPNSTDCAKQRLIMGLVRLLIFE